MLLALPDECKALVWRCFDTTTLCRVTCVARHVNHGVVLAPLWKRHAVDMVCREVARIELERLPGEGALQRQNATRRLDTAAPNHSAPRGRSGLLMSEQEETKEGDESGGMRFDMDERCWREWYRDFYLAVHRFNVAHAAFEAAKSELQTLKKQRSDLRELQHATKSKNQNDKQLRRMQMNCVRWLNRTSRRAAAFTQSRIAQATALTKSEVADELQTIESAIQCQSKAIFSLRSQYQKALHKRTSQVARSKQILANLDD